MQLNVGIATSGRGEILQEVLEQISRQTRLPDRVIVCPTNSSDVSLIKTSRLLFNVEIVKSFPGLTHQRNAIINAVSGDILVFFDDDFFPENSYLEKVECTFLENIDAVLLTGIVIADGATGPGISINDAQYILRTRRTDVLGSNKLSPTYNVYGCNMAIRLSPMFQNKIRFDEALPLYGWLEDVDFSRQMSLYGKVIRVPNLEGVHLGVKRGRVSGTKFGYSQIANPIHLVLKGTLSPHRAIAQISRNIGKNLLMVSRPEPWVDRRGRLRGNWLACRDLFACKLRPNNILNLE